LRASVSDAASMVSAFRRNALQLRIELSCHQIFPSLPFSNQRELVATNQRFRGQRTRIVIRSHRKAVRAGTHYGEQIAFMELRHFPIQRKKIARLAYRPDNVDLLRVLALAPSCFRLFYRHDLVITMIERRPNQVVHPSIDNRELLRVRFFDETHAGPQNTGVANKKTTGLYQNAKV